MLHAISYNIGLGYNGTPVYLYILHNTDGLMQDSSMSSALDMEILQFCTKSSICSTLHKIRR